MWPKSYQDYPIDTPLKQNQVQPGKGIIGCEMHELNGWGTTQNSVPPLTRPEKSQQELR